MQTNFFEQLAALSIKADWTIAITSPKDNFLIVSVLLSDDTCGDEARKSIPPMVLKGTPQELDEGFFNSIQKPAEKTAQLFADMEQYLKELEKVRKDSKMEEEKQKKEKTAQDERSKKYETQMKKVAELEEKEKWGEAIGAMPKTEQFPEHTEQIKTKMDELRSKHGQLSLL